MKVEFCAILCTILFIASGCGKKHEAPVSEKQFRETEKAMMGANRILLQKDRQKIKSYDSAFHLNMSESQSGLWFKIEKKGSGARVKTGDVVTLAYKISLLDGTVCYSSEKTGPKSFRVGQGGVESGLEEGILMLRKGDMARFVMPPHLAEGFTGDGDKIPPRTIIVYQVEVLNIEPS